MVDSRKTKTSNLLNCFEDSSDNATASTVPAPTPFIPAPMPSAHEPTTSALPQRKIQLLNQVVEDRGFKAFVAGLNPACHLPDRNFLSNNLLPALYETCQVQVKQNLETEAESVCLSTDIWTSSVNDAYLGVTAHYIDSNYDLKSVLLECTPIYGTHTAENIKNDINRIIQNFKLKEKVLILVTDNASNMKSAVEKMGFKHFGCYAHTLNLIVKHCTTESTADKKLCELISKQNGVALPKKVLQDVSTRWNSTLKMLERFVQLEDAIKATMALSDEKWESLTPEEWRICREMCFILKPFDQLTETMSAEKYVSGSQIIILTRGLVSALTKMLDITYDPLEEDYVDSLHDTVKNLRVASSEEDFVNETDEEEIILDNNFPSLARKLRPNDYVIIFLKSNKTDVYYVAKVLEELEEEENCDYFVTFVKLNLS
ncbi:unnamed protein product [Euphydryas editha]|uniref:Transposase n=1 Tax=Euphydryas editha TaxID=104508 RepID=A0AAU9UG67_EUPED|nr:unnamed protein product [Euphydryas editha]